MTDKAGILIGREDAFDVLKPYDNCILIVPNKLKKPEVAPLSNLVNWFCKIIEFSRAQPSKF